MTIPAESAMAAAFTGAAVMGAFSAVLFFRLEIREAWGLWRAGRADGASRRRAGVPLGRRTDGASRRRAGGRYRIVERRLIVHNRGEEA